MSTIWHDIALPFIMWMRVNHQGYQVNDNHQVNDQGSTQNKADVTQTLVDIVVFLIKIIRRLNMKEHILHWNNALKR